jgi:N-carbamoylputrescine amidase
VFKKLILFVLFIILIACLFAGPTHAIANGVYVAAVNRVGREGRLEFWGGSFVAEPEGRVLDQASHDREEVRVVDCDRNRITKTRHLWPFLRDRRIDAYGGLLKRWGS